MPAAPVVERIPALDIVRGVAVAGILLANVLVFFGLFALPESRAAAFPTAAADNIALFLEHVFVEGKFYSIFSLLFGIGFGLQLQRGGEAAVPRFKRRLRILLIIGAIHAFLIWAGDILMLYALLGFTMPWFARKSDRDLLRWAFMMLAFPTVFYLLILAIVMIALPGVASAGAGDGSGGMPAEMLAIFERVGTGGVRDALLGNLLLLAGRWAELVFTMRFPKVLGMFLIGLWLVRRRIATSPADHRATLVRWCAIGWAIGLPANVVAAWSVGQWAYLPPSPGGVIGVVMQALGFPLLAIGYTAGITLLVLNRHRVMNVFAPVGRMALTNYLMHSVLCGIISYGFGLGLWWQIGASRAMLIAAAIIIVQIPLSAWWLSRHRFGPVEWVWRRFTYGPAV